MMIMMTLINYDDDYDDVDQLWWWLWWCWSMMMMIMMMLINYDDDYDDDDTDTNGDEFKDKNAHFILQKVK